MIIAGVVALYWFVSITMVFLNKHLLSNVEVRTRTKEKGGGGGGGGGEGKQKAQGNGIMCC